MTSPIRDVALIVQVTGSIANHLQIARYKARHYTGTMSIRKQRARLKSLSFRRSDCPVSCALDVIGDKWTLLIIRDLFFGKTRYKEFQESKEGIPTTSSPIGCNTWKLQA